MPISKTFDKMFCNVLALGFSFMLVFTAFQTCGMIQNIVISSMKEQYEGYNGNGYISLAVVYAVFAISNWVAPSIIFTIGPKISMILGGISYSLFIANFFFHETWCLYLASAIIGFGASLFWTGQGNFLTINSDAETMSRNSGVFWALLQCSLLFGNIFVFFTFQGKSVIDEHTRFVVFGVLLGVSLAGLVLLCFLRSGRSQSVDVTSNPSATPEGSGPLAEFKKAVFLLKTKKMFCLAITFLYTAMATRYHLWSWFQNMHLRPDYIAMYVDVIYSILGSVYADDSAPAFALFKFFQSVAAAVAFFYSSVLELPYQLFILVVFGTLGTCTFWFVEWAEYRKLVKQKAEAKYKE
ncbi:UNC93-like protein MFSD11 like protein [Argiope bruennichi]|uniref:UNC93-like protein MFSD11 n=1 Tax=Argiope bruennichi TaxID=94029 RepID=A0A8T0FDQ0_ARGBR|nr:UNC93-like protein MFSD11 like protein [Argiope bruennichi]